MIEDIFNYNYNYYFISYSSKNKSIAEYVMQLLEEKGKKCFYAPRDIVPGSRYAGEIIKAIEKCDALLLVLTQAANDSVQVLREVNAAVSKKKPILPMRFERFKLCDDMQYYLGVCQYIDAISENGIILPPLISDKSNLLTNDSVDIDIIKETRSIIYGGIRKGLELFCNSTGTRYVSNQISANLIPRVSDFDSWLGSAVSIELKQSVELLWNYDNWNSLYIGKSGYGKTTACFLLINEYLNKYDDILPIYIDACKCMTLEGDELIVQYIKKTYVDPFHINISSEEIYELLYSDNVNETTMNPSIIVFIDGLSSCKSQDCTEFQTEFDKLISNHSIQTILLANSVDLPIVIGDIAVRRFDFQALEKTQIDTYLSSMGVNNCTISYSILSNPLILTIYAKTNDYLNKYKGYTRHYMVSAK